MIPPKDAFGEISTSLYKLVTKENFKKNEDIKLGMHLKQSSRGSCHPNSRVTEINENYIKLDANHPLAGINLYFEAKIVSIRAANQNKIAHGHLYLGAGCCGGGLKSIGVDHCQNQCLTYSKNK